MTDKYNTDILILVNVLVVNSLLVSSVLTVLWEVATWRVVKMILEDFRKRVASPDQDYPKWLILIIDIAATAMVAGMNVSVDFKELP